MQSALSLVARSRARLTAAVAMTPTSRFFSSRTLHHSSVSKMVSSMSEHPLRGQPVTAIIKKEHEMVRELHRQFLHSLDQQARRRKAMTLLYLLGRHSGAEEMLIYSYAKMNLPGGKELSEHCQSAHTQIHADLKQVDKQLASSTPDMVLLESTLAKVMHDLEQHVAEEEGQLLPLLEKHLSPEQLSDLGEQFVRTELMATSRPHPMAPKAGVAASAAHVMSKPLDLMRDAASGRNADIEQELKQFNLHKV